MPATIRVESTQHVIERDEAVGQNHALHRRMRDVALVPERDVLERRVRVAAQQPRQPDDLLAADRVALVRHRRRALLPFGERLLDFADLGLLQPANLERELLERRGRDGERRQQLRVPVALDDLRRHRRRLEPEAAADVRLDRGGRCANVPTAPESLPTLIVVARAPHPLDVALHFRVPERQLQAEGHRLGVHAVRAADHRRAPRARSRGRGSRRPACRGPSG